MIYIGIDVAKDKHDCFITNSEGEVLFNAFTIPNNADGFHDLFQKISSLTNDFSNVKVGLEATGHYNYNLLGFLIDKGLPTFVINPFLETFLVYRNHQFSMSVSQYTHEYPLHILYQYKLSSIFLLLGFQISHISTRLLKSL